MTNDIRVKVDVAIFIISFVSSVVPQAFRN